jgi:hypothetical protein
MIRPFKYRPCCLAETADNCKIAQQLKRFQSLFLRIPCAFRYPSRFENFKMPIVTISGAKTSSGQI